MYVNLDCIASHNFVRGVEDGDLSDTIDDPDSYYQATPPGSGAIEQVLLEYFHSRNLPTKSTILRGGADYDSFARYGIPFGGLQAQISQLKTEAEALIFGGTAGEPCDACYHQACDSAGYINTQVLAENAQAVAHLAQFFGDRKVTTMFEVGSVSNAIVAVEAVAAVEAVKAEHFLPSAQAEATGFPGKISPEPKPPRDDPWDGYHKDRGHRPTR